MNGNLIDTNIIIKLLNNDPQITEAFDKLRKVYIPVIAVGELAYGASKSKRQKANQKIFDGFVSEFTVVDIDSEAAKAYGQVKADLVKQGKNVPENDLWIAAVAISNDLTLITCDRHFESIPNLQYTII